MLVNRPDIVIATFRLRVIAVIAAYVATIITVQPVFGTEPHEAELIDGNLWVMVPNQGVFRIADNKVDFFSVTDHGGDKSKLPHAHAPPGCKTAPGGTLSVKKSVVISFM